MSVIDRLKPDDSNKGFLRALLAAFIFMLISGAILVAGFVAWHYPQIAAGAKTKPITLTGKDFYIAIGKGDHDGNKLVLKELDDAKSAVISSKKALFNASKYPVVEYRITGRTPGAAVVLYWRTVTHNHKTLFAKLHWNGDYLSAYNMSNEEEWKGAVTELGISVSGDLRNQPVSIEQITFSPWTVKSLLLLVWTEWNAFEGWSQKSINAIRGMPKHALISPVVAAAAWCGLAMLLYTLWLFLFRTPKVRFELEVEEARRSTTRYYDQSQEPHSRVRPDRSIPLHHPGAPLRHPDTPVRHPDAPFRHPGAGRDPQPQADRYSTEGQDAQPPAARHSGESRNPYPPGPEYPSKSRNPHNQPGDNTPIKEAHPPRASVASNKYSSLSMTRQLWDFKAIVIMFMIAWFALDGKWQLNLWRQLADTKYLFAGKSHHEQHLAAEDAQIYRFAKSLKKNFLPQKPTRLFILDSKWQSYPRLKLAYYLYPHNVFPYFNNPQPNIMKEGDYVLVLNSLPWVKFHAENKTLGSGRWKVSAKEIETTSFGGLYKIYRGGNH